MRINNPYTRFVKSISDDAEKNTLSDATNVYKAVIMQELSSLVKVPQLMAIY